jgi:hypothetical protein
MWQLFLERATPCLPMPAMAIIDRRGDPRNRPQYGTMWCIEYIDFSVADMPNIASYDAGVSICPSAASQ